MSRSILRQIVLAGLLALPLSPAGAQVLEVAVDASPAGLDPHIITAFSSFQIVNGTIYEGLTALDKDLNVIPALAQSWTVATGGKSYAFKIRPGVAFHNGAALEAADVVASLKRVMGKEAASPLASRLAAVEAIAAPDAATVTLTLKEPSAPLLTSLATIAIVPRAFESDKDGLQKQPVGTGPFKFKEWQPNGFVALEKHKTYWRPGLPILDGVKFDIVPESATRQAGLASGQYAILPNIDAATALQLKGRPNIVLQETLELAYTLLGFNTAKPPFDNPSVREAANWALDRPEIVQAALFGAGVPGGPLSPALKAWAVDVAKFPCYAHDPAKAQALLKASGLAQPVAVSLTVLPRQDIRDIAQIVQEELGKAGFKVELKTPELGQFIQDWRNGNFEMFASSNGGSPDPDDYFYRTFRSGGSTNVFKYSDAAVDTLLDDARATLDPASRKADYDRLQGMLACTGPIAHLAYAQLFTAMRTNVQGFEIIANRSLASLATVRVAP